MTESLLTDDFLLTVAEIEYFRKTKSTNLTLPGTVYHKDISSKRLWLIPVSTLRACATSRKKAGVNEVPAVRPLMYPTMASLDRDMMIKFQDGWIRYRFFWGF